MQSTGIKICGLTEPGLACAAAEAGANLLGLVFAQSIRKVTPQRAIQITTSVHRLKTHSSVVGVFVNAPVSETNHIAEYCELDMVQLSGDETPEYVRKITKPVIKVLHVTSDKSTRDIVQEIEKFKSLLESNLTIMLDTQVMGQYGGSGKTFSIEIAKNVSNRFPVFIAGGLTPENVNKLVKTVKPIGVDVSGGVETDGKKDVNKIKKFVEAVRKAENSSSTME